jgi:hypothetical protein
MLSLGDLSLAQAYALQPPPSYRTSFGGSLDELRIYDRPLTEAEVAALARH